MPLTCCQTTFSAKRCTRSSPLSLSACFMYARLAIRRGRPAAAIPTPATCTEGPNRASCAHLADNVQRQSGLDLRPGQPPGQHCQPVARIDHFGPWRAEEVGVLGVDHRQNSRESDADRPSGDRRPATLCSCRVAGFCRDDSFADERSRWVSLRLLLRSPEIFIIKRFCGAYIPDLLLKSGLQ